MRWNGNLEQQNELHQSRIHNVEQIYSLSVYASKQHCAIPRVRATTCAGTFHSLSECAQERAITASLCCGGPVIRGPTASSLALAELDVHQLTQTLFVGTLHLFQGCAPLRRRRRMLVVVGRLLLHCHGLSHEHEFRLFLLQDLDLSLQQQIRVLRLLQQVRWDGSVRGRSSRFHVCRSALGEQLQQTEGNVRWKGVHLLLLLLGRRRWEVMLHRHRLRLRGGWALRYHCWLRHWRWFGSRGATLVAHCKLTPSVFAKHLGRKLDCDRNAVSITWFVSRSLSHTLHCRLPEVYPGGRTRGSRHQAQDHWKLERNSCDE